MKRIFLTLLIIVLTITGFACTGSTISPAIAEGEYYIFALDYETWNAIKDCPDCTDLIDWQTIPVEER